MLGLRIQILIFNLIVALLAYVPPFAFADTVTSKKSQGPSAKVKATEFKNQQIQAAESIIQKLQSFKADHLKTLPSKSLQINAQQPTPSAPLETAPSVDNTLITKIYDRFIFALNSKYKAQTEVSDFLSDYSLDEAEKELENKGALSAFFAHLSEVIKNSKSERLDVAQTIENYIRASSPRAPLSAARFILNNSYSNGTLFQKSTGLSQEDLNDDESRITLVNESEKAVEVTDFEFSGEIEDWFERNFDEPTDTSPQTNMQDSQTEPSSKPATPLHDSTSPTDKPDANNSTPKPPTESFQATTALASELKTETN